MTQLLKPSAAARRWARALVAGAVVMPAGGIRAQSPPPVGQAPRTTALEAPFIGSDLEDRGRLEQLLGRDSASGFIVRSLSSRFRLPAARDSNVLLLVAPQVNLVLNTKLPFSQNDGALWAGRGFSYMSRGGVAFTRGPWRALVIPEIVGTRNSMFPDVDTRQFYRPIIDLRHYSKYSSPYMQHPFPMDQPFRPGPDAVARLDPGQSALWYEREHVAAGVSTENEWWGPGTHDALILTNNAGGFPHAFVRTARPLDTRFGEFEGRWLVGALTESAYFDFDPDNDTRTIAAAAATYRPRWQPELTVGLSRAVFAASSDGTKALLRWFDVVQPTRRPNARPWSDSSITNGRDQLTSLFARWRFPDAGAEVYGELGRAEWPASLRDFLVDPTHTMGYLLGGQVARPMRDRRAAWRLQGEFTFLERSTSYRYRPTQSWYASRAAPQGYTQRGQVLGASIGPGSSHQWLAFDVIAPRWSAGVFAGRWRLNADHNAAIVRYEQFPGLGWCEYDVNLYPGLRAGYRGRTFGVLNAEVILENRLNYLYQNASACPHGGTVRDVRNTTVRFWFTAATFP